MDPNATSAVPVKEEIVQRPSQFTDIDISPKRREGELYCDYRCRLWWVNRILKHYLKGRVVWPGSKGQLIGSLTNA